MAHLVSGARLPIVMGFGASLSWLMCWRAESAGGGEPRSAWDLFAPLSGALEITLVLAVLLLAVDIVSRDRDTRMMALIRAAPPSPTAIVMGKFFACLGGVSLALVPVWIVATSATVAMGWGILRALAWFAAPLLLVGLFLLGLATLVSTIAGSSRGAYASFACVLLLVFLARDASLVSYLFPSTDPIAVLGRWNPLAAVDAAAETVPSAFAPAWMPLITGAVVGISAVLVAAFVLSRQEDRA